MRALRAAGFACETVGEGTHLPIEQKTVDLRTTTRSRSARRTSSRGDGWVSTAWINFAPEGYTEDIVATLWG